MAAEITDLYVYPVKSADGIRGSEAKVGEAGFELDRRWMVVDENGEFISQRSHPELVLVKPTLTPEHLILERPVDQNLAGEPDAETTRIRVPRRPCAESNRSAAVWGGDVPVSHVNNDVDEWLSSFLGTHCELVYEPDVRARRVPEGAPGAGSGIAFADKYPFLLTSRKSLEALNDRLDEPIAMERFRPNLVVDGAAPFAEDDWEYVRAGGVAFRVAEPCTRCSVTTVDPSTGRTGDEPLETLAEFRRTDDGVAFGQYLAHLETGTLTVGDTVEVLGGPP